MRQVGHVKNTAPQLFDRSLYVKNLKRRDFQGLSSFYELIAQELVDRLTLIKRDFKQVVQIGSLGHGDDMLWECFESDEYLLLDEDPRHISPPLPSSPPHMSPSHARLASSDVIPAKAGIQEKPTISPSPLLDSRLRGNDKVGDDDTMCRDDKKDIARINAVSADTEFLPLAGNCADLIVSCLTLHYTNDIVGALKQIQLALKPDGFFQGVVLGGDSLKELHECLYKVSQDFLGGMAPVTPPMLTPQECGYLLRRTGFSLPVVDRFKITVLYDDLWTLLKDIQTTGQASPLFNKHPLGKDFLCKALELYKEIYTTQEGFPVTIDLIFLSGFKYHPSHPTALKPGTATKSLTDALS